MLETRGDVSEALVHAALPAEPLSWGGSVWLGVRPVHTTGARFVHRFLSLSLCPSLGL